MAGFTVETRIPFSSDDVFTCYRDDLPGLARYMSNVKDIEVKERKENGGVVTLLNHWRARAEIPAAVKAFVTEDKLGWLDHATWDAAKKQCDWWLEIPAFKDAVTCKGTTRVVADGATSRMLISGELTVDAAKVGVPRLMAGTVGKAVEAFAVALIKPNQEKMGEAVTQYLKARAGK
jgi:hypothetical protein